MTIPKPWAGILKELSAAAPSKVIDDCESRRKHGMLTRWRTARAGRHFLFYTLLVYYLCSWSTDGVLLVHICLFCLGSDLTAAGKTSRVFPDSWPYLRVPWTFWVTGWFMWMMCWKERGNTDLSCRLQVFQNDLAVFCTRNQTGIRHQCC